MFIHKQCARLAECLPWLQHDLNGPEDVLKVDADEDDVGGDDAADYLRSLSCVSLNSARPDVIEVRKK